MGFSAILLGFMALAGLAVSLDFDDDDDLGNPPQSL